MPTPTYTPLATVTLGASAGSITLSSIPATYRDLVLVVRCTTSADTNIATRFNGDTESNYSFVNMNGDGSAAASTTLSGTLGYYSYQSSTTNPELLLINIMDYSATNKHKSWLSRSNNASGKVAGLAGRWAVTSAITSILIAPTGGSTFATGTTVALYGIIS